MKITSTLVTLSAAAILSCSLPALATDSSFSINADLLSNIVLTKSQDMTFPDQEIGTAQTYVVSPTDTGAAVFTATGSASKNVTGSVTTASVSLTCTTAATCGTETITANTFTTGGDMAANGDATFDGTGNLSNLRIGASEVVTATNKAGSYAGSATFRLVYK